MLRNGRNLLRLVAQGIKRTPGSSNVADQLVEASSTALSRISASGNPFLRAFLSSPSCSHKSTIPSGAETISVTFINRDGSESTVQVPLGMNMLEAAHAYDIELEGACEGSLACSTCHVVVEQEDLFGKLPEPVEDEEDMLDLAFGLTETSRLGCQIIADKAIDGIRLRIPQATRNMAVDGFVPKPH